MAPYRPPGRSGRSNRTNADNDVFEGLPVKQWAPSTTRISLAPPASGTANGEDDKWGEPPMPRDYQLLQPWTQQLLRLARSGKVGTKRKPVDSELDEDRVDDEAPEEPQAAIQGAGLTEDRAFVSKKWRPVPEHALVPEHMHWEFLAKRRKGLPSLYAQGASEPLVVPMRRTKVQKADLATGEVAVYEVLVPEGQRVEGEVADTVELPDVKPVAPAPGTVIEGVGIANEEGVVVAEHLKPTVAPRRNRPPPKKKSGPGRGKKRVTFTNPDGSTYTTVVPNATKIVPQPGQTVKHVAKGESAGADVSAEQAAKHAASQQPEGEGDGEGEGEGEGEEEEGSGSDDGSEDDDREEGELTDEDAQGQSTPSAPKAKEAPSTPHAPQLTATTPTTANTAPEANEPPSISSLTAPPEPTPRDPSSSPELPLAQTQSRHASLTEAALPAPACTALAPEQAVKTAVEVAGDGGRADGAAMALDEAEELLATEAFEDGEEDLLGSLERQLEGEREDGGGEA